jgi:hypothetical protein
MLGSLASERAAVRDGLLSCAKAICNDVVFRRALRYRPQETLASIGLEPERVPATLPVRHYEIVAEITEPVLFGPQSTGPSANSAWPVELRLVRYGLKPMALIQTDASEACRLLRECSEHSLCGLLSPYCFAASGDRAAGGYVNVAANWRAASSTLQGWRGLLVARDWRQVQLGWLSMLFHWDEFLGLLLGYPECCVAAFPKNWESACAQFNGEVGAVLLAGDSNAPVNAAHCCMNLFARYFGFHLTEHFPCGFECEATVNLGERLLRGLRSYESQYARELVGMLSAPVLYAGQNGAFLFPDGRWEAAGAALHYSRVLASMPESILTKRLASNGTLPGTGEFGRLLRFPAAA